MANGGKLVRVPGIPYLTLHGVNLRSLSPSHKPIMLIGGGR